MGKKPETLASRLFRGTIYALFAALVVWDVLMVYAMLHGGD